MSVASSVAGNLLAPPLTVAFRLGVAAGAAVPKTAVHEDSDVVVGQYEVGLTGQPAGLGGVVNLESSRDGTHSPLGGGSLGCHATHTFRHLWCRSLRPWQFPHGINDQGRRGHRRTVALLFGQFDPEVVVEAECDFDEHKDCLTIWFALRGEKLSIITWLRNRLLAAVPVGAKISINTC